ncbi:MAG: hypothetical protein ABIQ70_08735 [Dokdonella sp.]
MQLVEGFVVEVACAIQAVESATSARDGFADDVEVRVEHRQEVVRALDVVDDLRGPRW